MGEDHAQAKRALRPMFRATRQALPGDVAQRRSAQVCARVRALPVFASAGAVVLYAAAGGEVDVTSLAGVAVESGKAVYFPRVVGGELVFLRALPSTLRIGPLGIGEPAEDAPSLDPAKAGVAVVVPGLAFDLAGVRLGRGGGYYDRALRTHPEATPIGVAYEFQIMPRLPRASWDIAMSAVVTDARTLDRGVPSMKEIGS